MTVSLGEEQRPASVVPSPPSETRPFGRWGGPALFLAALFLATIGSRDVLLLPLAGKLLGPEGMGRVMETATMFPALLVLPLAFLSDRVPRRESRRRLYLLLAGVMSMGAWASLLFVPLGAGPMTVIAVILGCATATIVVSTRGALVESARPLAATGRLAAGLVAAQAAATLFQLPIQQHLFERSPAWTVVAGTALGLTVTVLVGWSLVRRRAPATMSTTRPPASGLFDYLRSRAFWALLAVGMLVALATPDYLLDVLRPADVAPIPFPLRLQGDFLAKAGRLIAAMTYALACRRLAPRMLLPLALAVATLGVCALLAAGRGTSPAYELGMASNGFGQSLAAVALMDLAFRAAPRGHEALAFTLTAFAPITVAPALRNLWFAQGLAFSTDVAIGVGALLLAMLATRLVPAGLLDRPDGHRVLELP
ncbi:MAG TPA: hypothetical protein VHU40_15970 [Polyangia bacterium]|nr:hypothetical protein [Polyangia bacterium]